MPLREHGHKLSHGVHMDAYLEKDSSLKVFFFSLSLVGQEIDTLAPCFATSNLIKVGTYPVLKIARVFLSAKKSSWILFWRLMSVCNMTSETTKIAHAHMCRFYTFKLLPQIKLMTRRWVPINAMVASSFKYLSQNQHPSILRIYIGYDLSFVNGRIQLYIS